MIVRDVGLWSRQSTTAAGRPGGDGERPANPSPRIRQSSNDGDGRGANLLCTEEWKRRRCGSGQATVANPPPAREKTFPSSRGTFFSKKLLDCKKSTFCLLFGSLPLFVGKKGGRSVLKSKHSGRAHKCGGPPQTNKTHAENKVGGGGGGKDSPSSRILKSGSFTSLHGRQQVGHVLRLADGPPSHILGSKN